MNNIKVLYVEDDEIARENALEFLEDYFSTVFEAKDGLEALNLYTKHSPDIIITDIKMPKINGLDFIKMIREDDKTTQIIVTTAYSTKEYLLSAIELQLIKYLIKPIVQEEFEEAIELCLRSIKEKTTNIIKICEEYYFDTFNKTLTHNAEIIKLRAKEILFLELLLKNNTRYVTYQEIEHYVWNDSAMSKDALKSLVKRIKTYFNKPIFLNLSGVGYKIDL